MLIHALQSSGVDLSQPSISVQVELSKQANFRPNVPVLVCAAKVYWHSICNLMLESRLYWLSNL